nr:hypothetical protein CFP56_60857 [Quercus suber]
MPNVESYSLMVSPSYLCETSSKKAKKTPQMIEMLEKQMENFQSEIDNVAASIRQGNKIAIEGLAIMIQGHEIANEGLAIMEKGRSRCYSEEEVFFELVNIGIPTDMQLDAMLFLIKDPSKMRAFFGVPASELRRQILLKMISGFGVDPMASFLPPRNQQHRFTPPTPTPKRHNPPPQPLDKRRHPTTKRLLNHPFSSSSSSIESRQLMVM